MITIFTPAYNRVHTLERLYNSLCVQTSFDFEWLVIDDGSTDGTKSFFESMAPSPFDVRYYNQDNGGKHRAINKGVMLARGEWFFIVDSDDYLPVSSVEIIKRYVGEIEDDNRFCGITGLRVSPDLKPIGSVVFDKPMDIDNLTFRNKYKGTGDYAEVLRTSVLREYPFPEYAGEKFCTEALVLNRIAHKYLTRFVNAKIYICEYQAGGLTDTYARIMQNSPQAAMLYYKELLCSNGLSLRSRISFHLSYWKYHSCFKGELECGLAPTWKMRLLFIFLKPAYKIWHILKCLA
ncbi:glycosyltransferase family A protein [uncultured Bacteroides sp.]|uniref:glycosyltransferase family 2 protein n=1 Tax=uncultured Bacteroides sp. TaxID=162156 RepID=UPI0025F7153E|nr:glycosyltransferase family A protein [uncultured Bacteroides sp.]